MRVELREVDATKRLRAWGREVISQGVVDTNWSQWATFVSTTCVVHILVYNWRLLYALPAPRRYFVPEFFEDPKALFALSINIILRWLRDNLFYAGNNLLLILSG